MNRKATLVVVLVMAVAACGAEPGPAGGEVTTTTTLAESTVSAATTSTMTPLQPDQTTLVEAAIADLAQRLRVDPETITLLSFREVTWPDGSLGCPEEGKMYTQALVEGYQIALRHQDRAFDYHGAVGEDPFLCSSEEKDGGHEFVPPPGFND